MREIKFEYGFESVNGIVKKVYQLAEIPFIKEKCDVWDMLPIKYVRQFTGLKDKNGKEIYEGDILAFNLPVTGADGEPDFTEITARIDFQGGAFWFTGGGYTDCNWHFYNSKDREVIGNIYENPDLLTKL